MCSSCNSTHPDEQKFVNEHNARITDALGKDGLQNFLARCYSVYLTNGGSFIQERATSLKIETAVDSMNRWHAYHEGALDGENDIIGTGSTEDEAIQNFLEKVGVTI